MRWEIAIWAPAFPKQLELPSGFHSHGYQCKADFSNLPLLRMRKEKKKNKKQDRSEHQKRDLEEDVNPFGQQLSDAFTPLSHQGSFFL